MSFGTFHPGASLLSPVGPALGVAAGCVAACAIAAVMMRARYGTRARARVRDRWRSLASVGVAPSAVVLSTLISAAIWSLDVLRLRLAAAAFSAPIGLLQAATLTAITIVAGWVPTIGGLGAIEGGLIAGLVGMGVPPADAIAITAVERAISYGVGTLAGFVSLSLLGGRSLWKAVRLGAPVPEGATT
jgi:uncharacterized protein (TIRG00374 family)